MATAVAPPMRGTNNAVDPRATGNSDSSSAAAAKAAVKAHPSWLDKLVALLTCSDLRVRGMYMQINAGGLGLRVVPALHVGSPGISAVAAWRCSRYGNQVNSLLLALPASVGHGWSCPGGYVPHGSMI